MHFSGRRPEFENSNSGFQDSKPAVERFFTSLGILGSGVFTGGLTTHCIRPRIPEHSEMLSPLSITSQLTLVGLYLVNRELLI